MNGAPSGSLEVQRPLTVAKRAAARAEGRKAADGPVLFECRLRASGRAGGRNVTCCATTGHIFVLHISYLSFFPDRFSWPETTVLGGCALPNGVRCCSPIARQWKPHFLPNNTLVRYSVHHGSTRPDGPHRARPRLQWVQPCRCFSVLLLDRLTGRLLHCWRSHRKPKQLAR